MVFLKDYKILGELGSGGFATVYKVRHKKYGNIRAIRILNAPVTDEDSPTYQKFLRECKVLLHLGNGVHPNIVRIYEPRLEDNHALVEMDYVDGKDISHYLNEQGNYVPVDEVLRMAVEISSALAYCHEDVYKFCMDPDEDSLKNDPIDGSKWLVDDATKKRLIEKYRVIHNDIHSGNIMRREDGSFMLLDFGLAITSDEDVRKSSRHENGAVEFKAPEKWDNDAILTEQSDIYSFGIVMYEYLAGQVPFPYDKNCSSTEASYKLMKQHKEQQPPKIYDLRKSYYEAKYPGKKYEKDYPDWLEEAVLKCLEKTPTNRFKNGKELYEFIVGPHEDGKTKEKDDDDLDDLKESYKRLGDEVQRLKDENDALKNQLNKQTELKRCKKCGAELSENSNFCERCGKRVKPNKWLFVFFAIALLLGVGGLWVYLSHSEVPQPKLKPTYTISVKSSDEAMGTVNGGGTYDTIITVTIEALANEGYRFVSWNDGNKERQRKVVTDHNQEYEAQFEVERDVTPEGGGEEPIIPVVPKFVITVEPSNKSMGTVKGGGAYDSLAVVTIEAEANVGYHFVSWSDGNTKRQRTIKVDSNKKFVAKFDENIRPSVAQGSWNGVATYTGTWEGGVPHGTGGTLYFNSDYQLDLKDINGTKLDIKAGETIEDAKFVNGKLRQGTLRRKDGTKKWFNI